MSIPLHPVALRISKDDLGNSHQRADATHTVAWVLVTHGYARSVAMFLSELTQAFVVYRKFDKRGKEARAYNAAREALIAAAREFDEARRNLENVIN